MNFSNLSPAARARQSFSPLAGGESRALQRRSFKLLGSLNAECELLEEPLLELDIRVKACGENESD